MKRLAEIKFLKEEEKDEALKKRNIRLPDDAECRVCGCRVTIANLGMVIPKANGFEFVCNKEKCMLLAKFR